MEGVYKQFVDVYSALSLYLSDFLIDFSAVFRMDSISTRSTPPSKPLKKRGFRQIFQVLYRFEIKALWPLQGIPHSQQSLHGSAKPSLIAKLRLLTPVRRRAKNDIASCPPLSSIAFSGIATTSVARLLSFIPAAMPLNHMTSSRNNGHGFDEETFLWW